MQTMPSSSSCTTPISLGVGGGTSRTHRRALSAPPLRRRVAAERLPLQIEDGRHLPVTKLESQTSPNVERLAFVDKSFAFCNLIPMRGVKPRTY